MYLYYRRYTYPQTVPFISNQCPRSALALVFPDLTDPSVNPRENIMALLAWGLVQIGFFLPLLTILKGMNIYLQLFSQTMKQETD